MTDDGPEDPMDILRRRFAEGEIDEVEFQRRVELLGDREPDGDGSEADAPPIPDGDPEEWTSEQKAELFAFVADLDISEAANEYWGATAEVHRRRAERDD